MFLNYNNIIILASAIGIFIYQSCLTNCNEILYTANQIQKMYSFNCFDTVVDKNVFSTTKIFFCKKIIPQIKYFCLIEQKLSNFLLCAISNFRFETIEIDTCML